MEAALLLCGVLAAASCVGVAGDCTDTPTKSPTSSPTIAPTATIPSASPSVSPSQTAQPSTGRCPEHYHVVATPTPARCAPCPAGYLRPFHNKGDVESTSCVYQGSDDDNTHLERGNVCTTTYYSSDFWGDLITAGATECTVCAGGYRAGGDGCVACPTGHWRAPGDKASDSTECWHCATNWYVSKGACTACDTAAGYFSGAGAPIRVPCVHDEECLHLVGNTKDKEGSTCLASGFCEDPDTSGSFLDAPDTICEPKQCKDNEIVRNKECAACAAHQLSKLYTCPVDTCGTGDDKEPCDAETCGECTNSDGDDHLETCGANNDEPCINKDECEGEGCSVATCGTGNDEPCTTQGACTGATPVAGTWTATNAGTWTDHFTSTAITCTSSSTYSCMWYSTTVEAKEYWVKEGERGCGFDAGTTVSFDGDCPDQCASAVPYVNDLGEIERITVKRSGQYYSAPTLNVVYHPAGDWTSGVDTDCRITTPSPTVHIVSQAPTEATDRPSRFCRTLFRIERAAHCTASSTLWAGVSSC